MIEVIERFGVFGVFLLMVPESACIPVPSEVTLLFSGVAVHQGWMDFSLAVLAATVGNVVGSLLGYGLGASRLLDRVPAARAVLSRWEGLIDQHGISAVFIGRLLPLARTFVSLPAGARRLPIAPFVLLTTVGCAIWATAFVLVGFLASDAWTTINSVLGHLLLGVGVLVLAWSFLRSGRG